MIGPISAAVALMAFALMISEETRHARTCKALYRVRFDDKPVETIPTSVQLKHIVQELNLDAQNSDTKYWVHGKHIFSSDGITLSFGEAIRFRELRREHAFV